MYLDRYWQERDKLSRLALAGVVGNDLPAKLPASKLYLIVKETKATLMTILTRIPAFYGGFESGSDDPWSFFST